LPLAEISLLAGFADQSHFTREFRRVTGLTPHAFRSQLL
jgi:AraC family transcriptional regulator